MYPRMNTDKHGSDNRIFPFKQETFQIIGCAMEVHNSLGHGFLEKIYEKGLIAEFEDSDIPFKQQAQYQVTYKGRNLGTYIPDLIVFDKILVELKALNQIGGQEKSQILNYLKVTNFKVGLILNFGKSKLEWERMVL